MKLIKKTLGYNIGVDNNLAKMPIYVNRDSKTIHFNFARFYQWKYLNFLRCVRGLEFPQTNVAIFNEMINAEAPLRCHCIRLLVEILFLLLVFIYPAIWFSVPLIMRLFAFGCCARVIVLFVRFWFSQNKLFQIMDYYYEMLNRQNYLF